MNRDSFVFYKSFYEAIKNIPEEEQLKLYNAICEYSLFDIIPNLPDGIAKAMFILMKPNIDNANARYKASVENGKRGGRPRKKQGEKNLDKTQQKPNNNLDKTQQKPKQNLNDNVDVDVNVNDNDNIDNKPTKKTNKKANKKFVPPTLEEIENYCKEKNYNIDTQFFYEYFTEGNWVDSKGNKVKNWKQKIITWSKGKKTENKPVKNEWFDKKIEKEELSQEEEEEMKSILNKY